MKIIYIAHPYSNDPEHNLAEVRRIYNSMAYLDVIPFCPWYVTVLSLDENTDRALGMDHNKIYFDVGLIDEVWMCGSHISAGMELELQWAIDNNIEVINKIGMI